MGARFIPLETLGRASLTFNLLREVFGKECPYVHTDALNVSSEKLEEPDRWILSYPIRMLIAMTSGSSMVSPECVSASKKILRECEFDETAFRALIEDFEKRVRDRVTAIINEPSESPGSS